MLKLIESVEQSKDLTMADTKVDLKELKKLLSSLTLLYVEDNTTLQEKASTFFEKLFSRVYKASNGEEGLELFKQHHPQIIITDIQMPLMNGLEMANAIKKLDKNVKIIITSAYDDKEYLLKTISLGINGYLIKPLNVEDIAFLLFELATELIEERNKAVFNSYLYSIFNNQDNLIIMLKNETVILANEHTLHFFNTPTILEFKELFKTFESLLMPHDTFLYHNDVQNKSCLERVKEAPEKLFNIKLLDKMHEPHHFILKLTHISDKEDFFILSLTDITELNLLALYDQKSLDHDRVLKDEQTIYNLLKAAKEAGAVIKVYNFYKGLVVCNNAVLSSAGKNSATLKTSFLQQKAAQLEQKVILNSELFPFDLFCSDMQEINFQTQTIEIGKCVMLKTTPTERKNLILEPHPKYKVSLFYNQRKFDTAITMVNISVDATQLILEYIPAGFQEGDQITLDIVFSDQIKPCILNTKARVQKLFQTEDKHFNIVALFQLTQATHKILIDYMANRQMQLIREFKGLQL